MIKLFKKKGKRKIVKVQVPLSENDEGSLRRVSLISGVPMAEILRRGMEKEMAIMASIDKMILKEYQNLKNEKGDFKNGRSKS